MRSKAIAIVGLGLGLYLGLFFGCSGSGNVQCTVGYTGCGLHCVDVTTDVENCGACGTACISGEVCIKGTCTLDCATHQIACPTVSPTSCIDTRMDPQNCGGCDLVCPNGQGCNDGGCGLACPVLTPDLCVAAADGGTDASTGSGGSDAGSDLDGGTDAEAGLVNPGSGAFCTNLATDPANCGACGTACPPGAACVDKACTCEGLLSLCNGACVDGASDPNNCGACGTSCGTGLACVLGRCGCPGTLTACDADAGADAGFCADTLNENINCGTCGNVCGSGAVCILGKCQGGTDGG